MKAKAFATLMIALILAILMPARTISAQTAPTLTVEQIMNDPKWIGHAPSRPYWSEDGRWIYFYWNPERAESDSLYRVPVRGGTPEKVSLADQRLLPASSGIYSRDYRQKLFARGGDIYHYDVQRAMLKRITHTDARESNPRFTQDETGVIFQRGSALFHWHISNGTIREIAAFKSGKKPDPDAEPKQENKKFLKHEELRLISTLADRRDKREKRRLAREAASDSPPAFYLDKDAAREIRLSPDERFVTLRIQKKHTPSNTMVPDFVDESGYTKELRARPKVGSPTQKYAFAFADLERDTLVFVKTDELPGIRDVDAFTTTADSTKKPKPRDVVVYGPRWSPDGSRAFVDIRSLDNKDRWLALLDLPSGALTTIEHQRDSAWVGGPNISGWNTAGRTGWLPDSDGIWFCSEETGYSHLYAYSLASRGKTQLTSGSFEIYNPRISRDKKHWYFAANAVHPGERHLYRMALDGGNMEKLTALPGRNDATLSPDGKRLLIRHSYMNQPWELYTQEARQGRQAVKLTSSLTDEWQSYAWRTPEIVRIPASDGARPFARLYRPEQPNGAGVIFVHGAGYLQNAHKWWSSYFREYMFHNLLADRGYTVLDIDYRGSAGYGRDWRTAIYRHMGGKDLDDQVDGAAYLVSAHGIDPDRIGIYGGSYGGFITLMAMFTKAGTFASGAALRSVTDWAHYNHPYTSNILNIPQADTLAYRRSSPIYFAEGLQGHLLMCHGMIDTNVQFQDVVRLSQRLIELGKDNWELAVYPLEGHGFVEPSAWTDEYKRVLKLFTETIGPK